jgi:Protein of unknown function DUF262
MPLDEEIVAARKDIVSDGYDMSVGELMNLYKEGEIKIDPVFQRLFRWDLTRKTRFIESILLGLPLPPIFVYQDEKGIWELIDGLQRISTILEFSGILRLADEKTCIPSSLEGTRFLPSLAEKKWAPTEEDGDDGIGAAAQLKVKRARMRVEILKQESDPQAKYELFQRLNTGGSNLSEQEVRNCVGIMLNKPLQEWIVSHAESLEFRNTTDQTEYAIERQAHVELALRYFAFRHVPYKAGLDVHEYLDDALVQLATSATFERDAEASVFQRTFHLLNEVMGASSFKRWNGVDFSGKFLMSVFEVVALGVSKSIDQIEGKSATDRSAFLRERCIALWNDSTFSKYSGAGVRGTSRLANLLPMADSYFHP